jgi:hypothetical protein
VNNSHLSDLEIGDDPSLKLFGNRLGAPPQGQLHLRRFVDHPVSSSSADSAQVPLKALCCGRR